MERRSFIKASSALLGALYFRNGKTEVIHPSLFLDRDIYHFKIGEFKCTIFRDYLFKYQAADFFINAGGEEVEQLLKKYHQVADNIPSPFVVALFQKGDKKILVDTGVGFSEKPVLVRDKQVFFKGRLQQLLQKENIKKEDITEVILTHFHPDHIGGVFADDNTLNFPNARFYFHEEEWNYWHTSRSDNQPAQFKFFVEKNITKLKNHNLHLLKGDESDIVAGMIAVKAAGHTPGQVAVIISSHHEKLLYISDAFLHPLHIERLDWRTNYDLDHDEAKRSRTRLLNIAHKDHMLMNAFHFDFPGLGNVDRKGLHWRWNYADL